jgi:hypothetical protein
MNNCLPQKEWGEGKKNTFFEILVFYTLKSLAVLKVFCIFAFLFFKNIRNMNKDILEQEVSDYDGARRSIDEIKRSYPDQWIVLGNPVMDEYRQNVISGVVLYHSRDKRELVYRDKNLLKKYETFSMFFNSVTSRPKRSVIASIFSTLKT